MVLHKHRMEGKGIKVACLHNADLVGDQKTLKLKTLVTDLEYGDDMALLADNWSDFTSMLDTLTTCCKQLGLTINCKKTMSLAVAPPEVQMSNVQHASTWSQERSSSRWYPTFSTWAALAPNCQQSDCGMDSEINSRICKAAIASQSLSHILWLQSKIQMRTKKLYVRIPNSVILPPCCTVWRAQSSWSLTFAVLSPFRSTA